VQQFEWDPTKEKANRKKHGLSFHEAKELFTSGIDILEIYDEEHSDAEDRFIAIGTIRAGFIVVVYTEPHDEIIRIVSARKATKKEIQLFIDTMGNIND
jgi:uncharacterized DUF497 family protein